MQLPERLAARAQLQRGGAGDGRHGGLPAPARSRAAPIARTAFTWRSSPGCPERRGPARAGGARHARGRAPRGPGRAAAAAAIPGQLGLFARSRAPHPVLEELRDARRGHADAARGAQPAGRAQAARRGPSGDRPPGRVRRGRSSACSPAGRPDDGHGATSLPGAQAAAVRDAAEQPPVALNPASPVEYPAALLAQGIEGTSAPPALRRLRGQARSSIRPGSPSRAGTRRSTPPRWRGAPGLQLRARPPRRHAGGRGASCSRSISATRGAGATDAMTPPHLTPYDSVLDTIGWTPLIRLRRVGARHPHAGLRQGGVRQSRRIGEGPDRARDHRGRRAAGRAQAGRDDRRGHQRQHRRRARDRGGAQGLPLHLHDARQDVAGEGAAAQGLRRRGRDHARPRCRPIIPTTTS